MYKPEPSYRCQATAAKLLHDDDTSGTRSRDGADRRGVERRHPEDGTLYAPPASCEGFYERGLRCPECPEGVAGEFTLLIEKPG